MDRVEVVLVDAQTMFRSAIKAVLEMGGLAKVVGQAATCTEGLDRVRALRPRVVLMDLSTPTGDGLEATRRIVANHRNTYVLMLASRGIDECLSLALLAGAAGYVAKTSSHLVLREALSIVASGGVFPSEAASLLQDRYTEGEPGCGLLSAKEREIVALTARGFTAQETGKKLYLSPKTVETYKRRITRELGIHNRHELVRFALHVGLLTRL